MKISVMMVTARDLGMLPYQIDYFKRQTFKDFELVFVDELWEQRKDSVKKEVDGAFPLTHILPNEVKSYFAPGAAWNDGFTHCRGELLYFMADYIIPHEDCLRVHWETHLQYPKAMISGRCWEMNISADEFNQPNKQFQFNDYRLSLFENSYFRWSRIAESLYGAERAGVQNFWTGRNDSAPLDTILECNGFDEQFDGAHGYHDEDLAQRMANLGLEYIFNLKSLVWQFSHKKEGEQVGGKPGLRTDEEQHQMFKAKLIPQRIKDGTYKVNPDRNLREEREVWLK